MNRNQLRYIPTGITQMTPANVEKHTGINAPGLESKPNPKRLDCSQAQTKTSALASDVSFSHTQPLAVNDRNNNSHSMQQL
jgi:hypothetical protein